MGRHQNFDTHAVVRAARDLFWEQGYQGVSLPELERVTGLNRSSLYHAFGSKRGLFDAAVDSYLREVVRPLLAPLVSAEVAPDAVVDYLRTMRGALESPDTMPARYGCLLVGVAGSTLGHDPAARAAVEAYRQEMLTALTRGVIVRFPAMEPAEQSRRAETCAGLVIAALALARINPVAAAQTLDHALSLVSGDFQEESTVKGFQA
ncbi:TetR/AcrR family transcriptional regulator [Kocuria sp.]|uniref:TetR/AcrR family transcriptional regulator n=1 Tax=Kocuria sp. TaxID=1871328 RepID=UPI0026DFEBFD|nr:TetR/AcrR family transcriptional regulator [Kocuria sp.]MDO5617985.1 TetR/AcrR family transcriptional regulator [Kocuria sp.]